MSQKCQLWIQGKHASLFANSKSICKTQFIEQKKLLFVLNEVKFVLKPSCPSGKQLVHYRIIVGIYLPSAVYTLESRVSYPRTYHNNHGQGSNLGSNLLTIWYLSHQPAIIETLSPFWAQRQSWTVRRCTVLDNKLDWTKIQVEQKNEMTLLLSVGNYIM